MGFLEEIDTNTIIVLVSAITTLVTAIVSFRSSESNSKLEEVRTGIEVDRFERETNYDQAIQAAQVVNSMSTGLLDYYQGELRDLKQRNRLLEEQHDEQIRESLELKLTMRQTTRLIKGLNRALECELPNGTRDRITRLMAIAEDCENRGLQ